MTTLRPHPTHCDRCGAELKPHERTKRRRHAHWYCPACGNAHPEVEHREALEARWVDAGRPWLGNTKRPQP